MSETAQCPDCGGIVHCCTGEVAGIETLWIECEDCGYKSEPE